MSIADYRNFDLLITRAGERYRAFVVDAPAGAVVGNSGSGKSSLVYAGVLPVVRKARRFGAREWDIKTMRLGQQPLTALAVTLVCSPEALEHTLNALVAQGAAHRGLSLPGQPGEWIASSQLLLKLDESEYSPCHDHKQDCPDYRRFQRAGRRICPPTGRGCDARRAGRQPRRIGHALAVGAGL